MQNPSRHIQYRLKRVSQAYLTVKLRKLQIRRQPLILCRGWLKMPLTMSKDLQLRMSQVCIILQNLTKL